MTKKDRKSEKTKTFELTTGWILSLACLGGICFFIAASFIIYVIARDQILQLNQDTRSFNDSSVTIANIKKLNNSVEPQSQSLDVSDFDTKTFTVPPDWVLLTPLPSFAKVQNSTIVFAPQKYDSGKHVINFASEENKTGTMVSLTVNVSLPAIDKTNLNNQIIGILGDRTDTFGIYLYDNVRQDSWGLNQDTIFGPASICKVPIAILTLRNIDSGKASLDTTYPIQDNLKFSNIDPLGEMPNGTNVSLDDYLRAMISDSNNTALAHLDAYLGGSSSVNPRIISELGVNPYFYYPQQATPRTIGEVFTNLLNKKYLSDNMTNYLINLMKNADPDLRTGIGNGLPTDGSTTFANKVGFYETDQDLAYQDSAIVWSPKTDYILVILDRNIDWATAQDKIQQISSVVYGELNK